MNSSKQEKTKENLSQLCGVVKEEKPLQRCAARKHGTGQRRKPREEMRKGGRCALLEPKQKSGSGVEPRRKRSWWEIAGLQKKKRRRLRDGRKRKPVFRDDELFRRQTGKHGARNTKKRSGVGRRGLWGRRVLGLSPVTR